MKTTMMHFYQSYPPPPHLPPPILLPSLTLRRLSTLKSPQPTSSPLPSPSPPSPPSPQSSPFSIRSAATSSNPRSSVASTIRKSSATTSTTWVSNAGARSTVTPPRTSRRFSSASTSVTQKPSKNAIKMLDDDGPLTGVTICDAGFSTGSLSVLLARDGTIIFASDILAAMVSEAERKAAEALKDAENATMPKFEVKDLESLDGKYDTVMCLDVLLHYPQEKAEGMITHLASLEERRLLLSFAPKTFYFNLLKRVGELFPGPSKATRAYMHANKDIERALEKGVEGEEEGVY